MRSSLTLSPLVKVKVINSGIVKVIAMTLILFVFSELMLRLVYSVRNSYLDYIALPYVIGHSYGPTPPWFDRSRLLESDDTLVWKNRPNVRRNYIDIFSPIHKEEDRVSLLSRFLPTVPDFFKRNPVWDISLNSKGFRDREFPDNKSLTVFRIISLGDSWTFGANVGQASAFPQRLESLLKETFPRAKFEVFNLGVLGYSSFQGLQLMKQQVLALTPDVVVIGFAMNDASMAGYRDKDMPAYLKNQSTWAKTISGVVSEIEMFKLMRYFVAKFRFTSRGIGHHLKKAQENGVDEGSDLSERRVFEQQKYEKNEQWTRVSPGDYENNIREMFKLARGHGADVILLNNQLRWPESPYAAALEKISERLGIPLVDSDAIIDAARRKIEEDLEDRLDLKPPTISRSGAVDEIEVVFRVYMGNIPVSKNVFIAGAHPTLGKAVPNKIALYDDGTHGDQRAGDKVWSYAATFPRGTKLFYVYTNSGEEGKWEGLDVPHIRSFRVEAKHTEGKIYTPIESFGKIYMQADSWHTDASGYELIAKRVLNELKTSEKFRTFLLEMTDK